MMILYDYYRSTACYRVRIALEYKQIPYEIKSIHLVNQGGEQHNPAYQAINPQELVPCLQVGKQTISQSMAILDYLEINYPNPALLPKDSIQRAQIQAFALHIVCDIHPLNNLRVLNQLKSQFKATEEETQAWYHHWLRQGFNALESQLSARKEKSLYCFGNQVTWADVCLIPQVFNANRFNFPLDEYPLIQGVNDYCLGLDAFQKAAPLVA